MSAAMPAVTDGSSARTANPRRRFRLLDAMILVAATAMGCGVVLSIGRAEKRSPYDWCMQLVNPDPSCDDLERILRLSLLAMPLVATVTLALIPIRLSGARPRIRQVARQPGLMASCAAGVAIAFAALPLVVGALAAGARWIDLSRMLAAREEVWSATMDGGLAVLVSWITLFLSGRWRAERSWVDRFARVMGLSWIVAAFVVWAISFHYETVSSGGFEIRSETLPPVRAAGIKIRELVTLVMPLVAVVTLALIPIRLVGARPRFRLLARQPGLMASCAAGVTIALVLIQVVIAVIAWGLFADERVSWRGLSARSGWPLGEEVVLPMTSSGGLAVLVSWMTLLVGRQWRPEPECADRLGRALGFCWILAALAVAIGNALIHTDYIRRYGVHP